MLLLEPVTPRTAAEDYYVGMALAQLGRLSQAQAALEAGRRLAPADPRFPVELAGIAFKQKDYPQTTRDLRQALRLAPNDAYANDFLGTAYFLEGNLEAALKYWNRAGKPQIEDVREDPTPRVSPALLDHAFAFSPAATLTLPANPRFRTYAFSGLGIFPQFHFDLNARTDGKFDFVFRARELNGFGGTRLESLFLFFQGLPFQEVNPQYYNITAKPSTLRRWSAGTRRSAASSRNSPAPSSTAPNTAGS